MKHFICFGDSITDCGKLFDFPPLGNGYVHFLNERFTESKIDNIVINNGFDGFTIKRILNIVKKRPIPPNSCCTLLAGINDVSLILNTCRSSEQQKAMLQDFFHTYETTILEILKSAEQLILIEPFIFSQPAEFSLWIPCVRQISALIRQLSEKYALPYLLLHDSLNQLAAENGFSAVTTDGIHLTAFGHQILADKLFPYIKKTPPVI